MTTCSDMAERVTRLAEGALSPAERSACDTHLDGCPSCTALVAQHRRTVAALRSLPAPPLPAPLREAILAGPARRQVRRAAWRSTVRLALAAVGAALVAAFLAGHQGTVELSSGLHCLLTELLWAGGVGGAAWVAQRRGAGGSPALLGGGVLAGALLGDGYLHFRCGAASSLPHLLVFHVGGVLLVALVALGAAWPRHGRAVRETV
jgi:anti-sigma factor RsiW